MTMDTPWGNSLEGIPSRTDIGLFFYNVDLVDLSGYEEFPNARWSEIFAIVALSLIDKAIALEADAIDKYAEINQRAIAEHEANKPPEDTTSGAQGPGFVSVGFTVRALTDHEIAKYVGTYAIMGAEAIGIAEALEREVHVAARARLAGAADATEKLKLSNKRASIKRHAKTNQLLLEIAEFRKQKPTDSIRNTVRRFLEAIPEERVEHLRVDNRINSLSDAFSDYLKGRRAPLPDEPRSPN
jgi:hypothetical protein